MKNHICKVVAGILSVIATPLCQAVEPTFSNLANLSLDNLQPYLEAGIPVRAAPEFVNWENLADPYNLKAGIDVQFLGQRTTVTLGFIRGSFDAYTQTFKTEPVISLHVNGNTNTSPYVRPGQALDSYWSGTGWDSHLITKFDGNYVTISNFKNPSEMAFVYLSDLREKWKIGASRYCSKHLNKKYCLVPQNLWNDSREHQSGFVITENTPLYYTTSMPQDYVDLFKQRPPDYAFNFKPIAYSLALRLTFVLSDPVMQVWQIRQMTAEEAADVMLDESKSHKQPFASPSLSAPIPTIRTKK